MYISKAAQLSGTTIKTIRHYEAIGLLPAPQRRGNYRVYSPQSIELLIFIKCAQQLGFKLKEMQAILLEHQGQVLPWEVVSNAIACKKQSVLAQIEALHSVHAGLIAFENHFKSTMDQCPVQGLIMST